jgi:hypothetical protein
VKHAAQDAGDSLSGCSEVVLPEAGFAAIRENKTGRDYKEIIESLPRIRMKTAGMILSGRAERP